MKGLTFLSAIVIATLMLVGCYSPQGNPDYTASGALAGAATGAIIGSTARNSEAGALVGGAIGGLVGGLIGHGMDQAQETQLKAQAPETMQRIEQDQPLTVEDIQAMVKAGIGDDLIISQIRNSRTVYYLTTTDIIALKNAGVSEKVIDYMINTPSLVSATQKSGVVGPAPPAPLPEPIYAPPGAGYIWVEGTWLWLRGRWTWRPGYWHRSRHPYWPPRR